MFKAFVLVRNFDSAAERLDFGDFTIERIGLKFPEFREVFSSVDVNQDDWILEKSYTVPPSGPPGSPVGGIPNDLEDILVLFRLYKVGDIAFVKQAIIPPSGNRVVQFPYRAMNDLNSYSAIRFDLGPDECEPWKTFAKGIQASQSWRSEWFGVARRFFLYGGAKEFNPRWDDVDRIVDYATALEAAVVPESEFSSRRFRHRAALLVSPNDPEERKVVCKLVRQVYDLRSGIVHGSKLSKDQRDWLIDNCRDLELRVRQVLTAAVQNVPAEEAERRTMLAALYDPTDEDRGDFAFQKFQEIRTDPVQKAIAEKIARRVGA
jgi:hypothetical protein